MTGHLDTRKWEDRWAIRVTATLYFFAGVFVGAWFG